jgi:hypothetical protein
MSCRTETSYTSGLTYNRHSAPLDSARKISFSKQKEVERTGARTGEERYMLQTPNTSQKNKMVFFVHVMKTGGTSVRNSLFNFYPEDVRYPSPARDDPFTAKASTRSLLNLSTERRNTLQFVSTQMPLSVALQFREETDPPTAITMVLRDGLERAISHLNQLSRRFNHAYSYRQLLDLPLLRDIFLSNHQTRMLSMGTSGWDEWDSSCMALIMLDQHLEKPDNPMQVSRVTEADLQTALEALPKVDVLGLQSESGAWWQQCQARFGWPQETRTRANTARRRIQLQRRLFHRTCSRSSES